MFVPPMTKPHGASAATVVRCCGDQGRHLVVVQTMIVLQSGSRRHSFGLTPANIPRSATACCIWRAAEALTLVRYMFLHGIDSLTQLLFLWVFGDNGRRRDGRTCDSRVYIRSASRRCRAYLSCRTRTCRWSALGAIPHRRRLLMCISG